MPSALLLDLQGCCPSVVYLSYSQKHQPQGGCPTKCKTKTFFLSMKWHIRLSFHVRFIKDGTIVAVNMHVRAATLSEAYLFYLRFCADFFLLFSVQRDWRCGVSAADSYPVPTPTRCIMEKHKHHLNLSAFYPASPPHPPTTYFQHRKLVQLGLKLWKL